MDGSQIKRARERAGWTQAELGRRIGVGERTIGNYERDETGSRSKGTILEDVLRPYLDGPSDGDAGPLLHQASDAELLFEVAGRLAEARGGAERSSAREALDEGSG